MNTETEFSKWFDRWLLDTYERAEQAAEALGTSTATISAWRNGSNAPRWEYIVPLARLTGKRVAWLAHLAYGEGWEDRDATDPLMKEPLVQEALSLFRRLLAKGPELMALAVELLRGLERHARKVKGNGH